MEVVTVNLGAVVAAAVASMIIGFIWYHKGVFGREWMRLVKMKETGKMEGEAMGKMVIAALLTAYVLAHIVKFSGSAGWYEGAIAGFMVWLGFYLTTSVMGDAFEHRPMKLTGINVGYHLVNLLVMGAILASM
jgi:hypothetical protein